jgi:hypothetical protein
MPAAAAKGPHSTLKLFVTTSPGSSVAAVGCLLFMLARRPSNNILKCALFSVFLQTAYRSEIEGKWAQNAPPILRLADIPKKKYNRSQSFT